MDKKEYIERERIEKFFDGIYDCADLTFEPNGSQRLARLAQEGGVY